MSCQDGRDDSLCVQGAETVCVGQVGVQDSYLSDRLMMVTGDNSPLYTISANINLTRLMAVSLELAQDTEGRVQWELIENWLQ